MGQKSRNITRRNFIAKSLVVGLSGVTVPGIIKTSLGNSGLYKGCP